MGTYTCNDEFDRMFKKIVRVSKEINRYSQLKKWFFYHQSYFTMKTRFIESAGKYSTYTTKSYPFIIFSYTWAFQPAWDKFGYNEYVKDLYPISSEIHANSRSFL